MLHLAVEINAVCVLKLSLRKTIRLYLKAFAYKKFLEDSFRVVQYKNL